MSYYRVLSLDGGGIRGVLTAKLLERLEEAHPGFLAQIDLIAGTSTGGLLALGLAAGLTPAEASELYKEKGEFVFADSTWDDVRDLGLAIGAQYGNENLKQALTEQLGDQTLGQLSKKVLVSTFDLDNEATEPGQIRTWKAKFFHNYPGPNSDEGESVVDVAIRTSAAPVYFPVYQGYIDGGVVANNPSMCALAQALHGSTGGQRLQDVALLSLGTGRTPVYLEAGDADWGWVQWAKDLRLIGIMLDGSIGLANYQCRQVLDEQYHRLNPSLPVHITMDDVQEIPVLEQVADKADLTATIDWLVQYF